MRLLFKTVILKAMEEIEAACFGGRVKSKKLHDVIYERFLTDNKKSMIVNLSFHLKHSCSSDAIVVHIANLPRYIVG